MLLSVFYEPQIECNVVAPWLQGTLAAIDCLAGNKPRIVARACMARSSHVAYLWLGVAILGLQQRYLQDVGRGQIPFDLHSAAWSGTLQSFIQQPTSCPLVSNGRVKRADECRLLFLSRSDCHARAPVCQWRPFGTTSVEDLDAEVRAHTECQAHKLQYHGLRWSGEDTVIMSTTDAVKPLAHLSILRARNAEFINCCEILDRGKEVISENTTRSIFGWLRPDGRTCDEKAIFQHPWLDMSESDSEDEAESPVSPHNGNQGSLAVALWLHNLDCDETVKSRGDDAGTGHFSIDSVPELRCSSS